MGKISEALRVNLREVAQSDARSLREISEELQKANQGNSVPARLKGEDRLNLLLGKGSFEKQSVKTLRSLCKENGLKRFSGLNKSALCKLLKENNVQAPPPPLEKLTKAELIKIIHSLMT